MFRLFLPLLFCLFAYEQATAHFHIPKILKLVKATGQAEAMVMLGLGVHLQNQPSIPQAVAPNVGSQMALLALVIVVASVLMYLALVLILLILMHQLLR
jgi:hypothetical protein